MPDVLEAPVRQVPHQLVGHAFDKVTAMLAVQRRRELRAQRDAFRIAQALTPPPTQDDFNQLRLGRVREQLVKLDAMLSKEEDPQKLDRLASAQARLSEQERILDGRPLPGSRRPSSDKQDRKRILDLAPVGIAGQILDMEPAPAAPARPAGWEYQDPPGLERSAPTGCGVPTTSEPVAPPAPPQPV